MEFFTMQVLTQRQIKQLNITVHAACDALVIVDDSICHTLDRILCLATSDRALAVYRTTLDVVKLTAILAAGLAFYAGVLARYAWEWLKQECSQPAAPCLELPAAVESEPDAWQQPITSCTLLTSEVQPVPPILLLLPPAPMPAQPKSRRRKTTTATAKKRGGKAKATAETVSS